MIMWIAVHTAHMASLGLLAPRAPSNFCGNIRAAPLVSSSSCSFLEVSRVLRFSLRCNAIPAESPSSGGNNGETWLSKDTGPNTNEIGMGVISAQITPVIDNFFSSDVYGDPDRPSQGFSPVPQAIAAIGEGKCVLLVDNRNLGYLVMAASLAARETMAFIVREGSGLVYCPMTGKQLDMLRLPLMTSDENHESNVFGLTITVDVKLGTSTGVSAQDRANTVLALSSEESRPEHFRRPGHIFPIRCHQDGVLGRLGHAEAACDLVKIAGLPSVAVCSELVDQEDLPGVSEFATNHGLPILSIDDLVRYVRKRQKLVERTAVARLPTKWGDFKAYSYKSKLNNIEHVAFVKGDIEDGQDVLVRVHSECLTGDILGSLRCPCGNSLETAMERIENAGRGVLVYLRGHEGMRIGLSDKLEFYDKIDKGKEVAAAVEEQDKLDSRDYGIGAQILRDIGVRTMKLMTNNPSKYLGLRGYGLAVTSRIPA